MSLFDDDVLPETGATEEQRKVRLAAIEVWFGRFAGGIAQTAPQKAHKLKWIENPAELINNDYWELMHARIKPRIIPREGKPKRADRHKIASLLELLINWHQPIVLGDHAQSRLINAQLAYFCALNIIGNWNQANLKHLHISDSFASEHLALLRSLPDTSDSLPIFSNAASWYLVETIAIARQHNKIP